MKKGIITLSLLLLLVTTGCSWQETFQEEKESYIDSELKQHEETGAEEINEEYEEMDTTGWNEFNSAIFPISFKYPTNWTFGEERPVNPDMSSWGRIGGGDGQGSSISIYRNGIYSDAANLDETLDEHMQRMYEYYVDQAENHDGNIVYARPYSSDNYEPHDINGYPAYRQTGAQYADEKVKMIFVKMDKPILAIVYTDATSMLDNFEAEQLPQILKILSTLMIVNEE